MKDRELEGYYKRLDILDATARQIINDFELLGIEVKFSGDPDNAYEELFKQIYPHINDMIRKSDQKLIRVFQKIDLNEKLVKDVYRKKNSDVAAGITQLIIKRELQKVVIRMHYKPK
ncbi:MAG: hypothetical protein HKN22_02065 [Bacteroidia bacterium]|nr:hypothetical protein [Bacteroidia bacterium]